MKAKIAKKKCELCPRMIAPQGYAKHLATHSNSKPDTVKAVKEKVIIVVDRDVFERIILDKLRV